ncbi:MAG: phosphoglycerate kinase, partial [Proteobacteria bacterium]|nr:phosphoglycerate kinase [Pseudomonadota bacterium]
PLAAIIGGAKVSTKIGIVGRLAGHVDMLVIGGAMANTFLLAQGRAVGKSLVERDATGLAAEILDRARAAGCEVVLPEDVVTTTRFEAGAPRTVTPVADVADDAMILDIGPATAARIVARLEAMKTVVWNGPLGAFELAGFDHGTNTVARAVARLTRAGLVSVAGGGDTLAALAHAGAGDGFTYVSTAGGAFLEWLEGKELPGVAALGR